MQSIGHLSGYKEYGRFYCFTMADCSTNTYQNNYTSDQPQMVKLLDTF